MADSSPITVNVWEDSSPFLMARITSPVDGTNLTSTGVASVAYTVYDIDGVTQTASSTLTTTSLRMQTMRTAAEILKQEPPVTTFLKQVLLTNIC